MADSPFSFHCMICIEEFDADTRYPVVLPCGHTYVCAECAVRLDKCMECRTPLFAAGGAAGPESPQAPYPAGPAPPELPPMSEYERRLRQRGRPGSMSRSGALSRRPPGVRGPPPQSTTTPPRPAAAAPKQRLPLPKNAVLLSLMEATEIASEGAKRASEGKLRAGGAAGSSSLASDERTEEEVEEEKIRLSTSIAAGTSGTYVVQAAGGLTIVPERPPPPGADVGGGGGGDSSSGRDPSSPPRSPLQRDESFGSNGSDTCAAHVSPVQSPVPVVRAPSKTNSDVMVRVDSMVHDYRQGEGSPGPGRRGGGEDEESDDERSGAGSVGSRSRSPVQLLKVGRGDRVQVVSMEGGWAKLARGYGFVHCPRGTELVKVGGSMDKACQLEAMLQNLAHRRNDLKKQQNHIDQMTVRLMKDFHSALHDHDDLTVVVGSAFSSPQRRRPPASPLKRSGSGSIRAKMNRLAAESSSSANAAAAEEREGPSTKDLSRAVSDDTEDPRLRKPPKAQSPDLKKAVPMSRADSGAVQDQNCGIVSFARGAFSSLYGGDGESGGGGRGDREGKVEDRGPLRTPPSYPPGDSSGGSGGGGIPGLRTVPSHITAGAREWRRQNNKAEARGPNIDFRTGLSGHTGLTVPHHSAHPHDFIDGRPYQPQHWGGGAGGDGWGSPATRGGGGAGGGGRRGDPAPRSRRMMSAHTGLTFGGRASSVKKRPGGGVGVVGFSPPAVVSSLYSSLSASLDRGEPTQVEERAVRTP